jgi:hypothetical protein
MEAKKIAIVLTNVEAMQYTGEVIHRVKIIELTADQMTEIQPKETLRTGISGTYFEQITKVYLVD